VRQAAFTSSIPADDGGAGVRIVADGRPALPGEETGASLIPVTAGLFETLGAPLLDGRAFTDDEVARATSEVAIVNRGLARRFWPEASAVGRRIGLVQPSGTVWLTIVGVAPEVQYEEFGEETAQSRLVVYVPYARSGYRTMALMVRCEGEPGRLAAPLRAALRGLDAGLPSYEILTMRERRAFNTWEERLFGRLMGTFAAAAVFFACLGVYGVLAHGVSRRTQEIGVRIALGARRRDILSLVLRRGATLAALGVLAGLGLAIAMARVLSAMVYGVDAGSPWMIAGMAALLGGVVLLASVLPARRAAGIDPIAALRCE
jgi:predicted permease